MAARFAAYKQLAQLTEDVACEPGDIRLYVPSDNRLHMGIATETEEVIHASGKSKLLDLLLNKCYYNINSLKYVGDVPKGEIMETFIQQLPEPVRYIAELEDDAQYWTTAPHEKFPIDAYVVVLVLRWIFEVINSDRHGALKYHVSWELAESKRSDVPDMRVFVETTEWKFGRRGEPSKHEVVTLESFGSGVYVARFTQGSYGPFGHAGADAIWRVIEDAVMAPHPQDLPYYEAHDFVSMERNGKEATTLQIISGAFIREELNISLEETPMGCKITIK